MVPLLSGMTALFTVEQQAGASANAQQNQQRDPDKRLSAGSRHPKNRYIYHSEFLLVILLRGQFPDKYVICQKLIALVGSCFRQPVLRNRLIITRYT